jgi:dolichol-phosphate mannosyltransferase
LKTTLSIIIPVFNEKNTIEKIVDLIIKLKSIKKQIIVIDDYSTDGSREIIKKKLKKKVNKIILQKRNFGKGYAIKSAQRFINGEYTIIQDADLEYNPKDYKKILTKMKKDNLDILYGSRVLGKKRYLSKNFTSKLRIFFNHILTEITNLLYNQKLTDAHTCYKIFKSKIFKKIILNEKDFAFCPEITSIYSKLSYRIPEIPIRYKGRTYEEGKKISLKDGFRALFVLVKYKFTK